MSASAWLAARSANVPAALMRRVLDATSGTDATRRTDETLLEGALQVARGVLDAEPMERAHALDLLAADALVTFAFEAAAEEPSRVAALADPAMRRIAELLEERT